MLLDDYTPHQKRQLKQVLLNDFSLFVRFFHKVMSEENFILSPMHKVLHGTLQRVVDLDINRLIISMPPGMGKTHSSTIMFESYGIALNPRSKFIQASYGADISALNSLCVKDIIETEEYQDLFDIKIRTDKNAKANWSIENYGGGVYATSMLGQVTGFRAGYPLTGDKHFRGAISIDDPQKTSEILSEAYRNRTNRNYPQTFASRLAQEDVPIIIVQQRLDTDDLSGALLTGLSGEKWHHLSLPALIPDEPTEYDYQKYTHGIPIDHNLPSGALWSEKLSLEDCEVKRNSDNWVWQSQYLQQPMRKGGGIFKGDWFIDNYYNSDELPTNISHSFITLDSAMKTGEHNDFSVMQCWAATHDGHLYLLDQNRGKWEAPELETEFVNFYRKWDEESGVLHRGVRMGWHLRSAFIEDKASGTGLIQSCRRKGNMTIFDVQRNRDKISRYSDIAPHIAAGKVHLPRDKDFTAGIVSEAMSQTRIKSGGHDDQIDPMADAVDIHIIKQLRSMNFSHWM